MAWRLAFFMSDNNGHEAETGVNLREGTTFDGALAYAQALESALSALSSARIDGAEYKRIIKSGASPGNLAFADMRSDALLFYRNGLDFASFRVPSPKQLLFESSGPYADVRITRQSLDVSGLLAQVDNFLAGCLDPLGRPYPTSFIVGGRSRI